MSDAEELKTSCMASTSADDAAFLSGIPYLPLGHKVAESIEADNALYLLQWVNFAASLLFLIQLVVYAALALPLDVQPSAGQPADCNANICETEVELFSQLNIHFTFPIIMGLAYLNHLVFFMYLQFRDVKVRSWMFVYNTNPIRMIEYILSYPLCVVATSVLIGVADIHLWLLCFFSTMVGVGLGQAIALIPRIERPDLWPLSFRFQRGLLFGHLVVALLAPWAVLLCYYARAVQEGLAAYAHVAFWTTLLSVAAMAANVLLHNVMRRYDLVTAEIGYINISLVAKTLLCAAVYAGVKS